MKSNISILNLSLEKVKYFFSGNEKYHKWVEQPTYEEFYNTIPEHTSAIDFILSTLVVDRVEDLDFWTLQKIGLDYLLYGGYCLKVSKLRNGTPILDYIDIAKIRFSPDYKKVGVSEEWSKGKTDVDWYPLTTSIKEVGIYYFKNNKSKKLYPTPHYHSASLGMDTMNSILKYHNENARHGFTPSVLINFNNGDPGEEVKKEIEKSIRQKFTGEAGQRFILAFNKSQEQAVTFEKLDNDNLDQKFETLQKFIQNQILVAHSITSPSLLGIKPENQGFSKTEFEEALSIFLQVKVSGWRRELEYSLSKLTDKEVLLGQIKIEEV